MLRKLFGFVLKAIWVIVALLSPTTILFLHHALKYAFQPRFVFTAFLYIAPVLLIVIGICVALFIWKKPYGLFAMSLGFLLTPVSYLIMAWFLGGRYWRDVSGGFGGVNFSIIVTGIWYAVPFAVLSFLPAIPMIVRWSRRKNANRLAAMHTQYKENIYSPNVRDDTANKPVDSTESEGSNETVE